MKIEGSIGHLRVGHRWAAEISNWSVFRRPTLGPVSVEITAVVRRVDDYWCTQQPFQVALWLGRSWWVWEGATGGTIEVGSKVVLTATGDPKPCTTLNGVRA